MFHYFASLGKKPWAKSILPVLATTASGGYLTFHMFGHQIARDILAASSGSGERGEISKNLQNLIKQVYYEIKDDYNKPIIETDLWNNSPPTIRWFASCTPDPITLGMSETRSGVAIGLPSYYNYEKREDVPDNILEINRFKLFKSWDKGDTGQDEKPNLGGLNVDEDNIVRTLIDKNKPDAQNYIDSLVLSENAKKFSVARELFLTDTYRPLALGCIILTSASLSIFISRAVVSKLRLMDTHLTYRLPYYFVSGLLGYINYMFISDSVNQTYSIKADSRAIKVHELYREGAVEYFTKTIQRNKALRNLVDELAFNYDEEGNIREQFYRRRHIPLTERLAEAQKKKSD